MDDSNSWERRVSCLSRHLTSGNESKQKIGQSMLKRRKTSSSKKLWTMEQVLEKREEGFCYVVIKGKVYDVTDFLEEHPGGAELITDIDPEDLEQMNFEFDDAEHSDEALEDMREMYVGKFVDENGEVVDDSDEEEEDESEDEGDEDGSDDENAESKEDQEIRYYEENAVTPFAHFQELDLPLVDKHQLSHDVVVFRFALPSPDQRLGLPNGTHILLSFQNEEGATISRAYTPVSPRGEVGFIDFLIKLYPNGKMSNHLNFLEFGQTIKMRGPKGKLVYYGHKEFTIEKKKNKPKRKTIRHIGMIAGGSGITPMFQIIQAVANDPTDDLEITLLFANKTEADIILRDALEAFGSARPNIHIHYTLDYPPANWDHKTGFITKQMLQDLMPPPAEDVLMCLCGPPPMIKKACVPALQELGYDGMYFKF